MNSIKENKVIILVSSIIIILNIFVIIDINTKNKQSDNIPKFVIRENNLLYYNFNNYILIVDLYINKVILFNNFICKNNILQLNPNYNNDYMLLLVIKHYIYIDMIKNDNSIIFTYNQQGSYDYMSSLLC